MPREPSLFSTGDRPDLGPPPYAHREYEILDRSHLETSERLRRKLDEWYTHLPEAAANSIRNRFVSGDDIVHLGAFFELYLHQLALRLCDTVAIDVGLDASEDRQPDFEVSCGGEQLFVEATAVGGFDFHTQTERLHIDQVYDAVNAATTPAFGVSVDIEEIGTTTPSARRITAFLQTWLDQLDPDVLYAAQERGTTEESRTFARGGWRVRLSPYALAPEHRRYPHHRLVGSRGFSGGGVDDVKPLRKSIQFKATRYGEMNGPFVVAVLCAGTFVDDRDITSALLGPTGYWFDPQADEIRGARQRDGVWARERGPVHTRLAGVLTFAKLTPSTIAAVEPTLWTNPWASHPITRPGPWRRIEGHPSGRVREFPASRSIAQILGLPPKWPYR